MAKSAGLQICATAAKAIAAVQASGGANRVPAPLVWDPSRHLLSRFAFGPVGTQKVTDPDAWWTQQVALGKTYAGYAGIPDSATRWSYLPMRPAQTRKRLQDEGQEYAWPALDQLNHATLALQTWSPAQLYETLVDVFANRLNIANYADNVWCNRASFDRDVIRANVFGTYQDMLLKALKHPAMLYFLNNDVSTWDAPNENLGRELLELHTVGRGANYTQADVVDSARILTGRGVDWRTTDYMWSQGEHYLGPVKVLGFSSPNDDPYGGEAVGDAYVRYLANHPSTATSIARMLCVRFVSDTPSDALVAAVAAAYTANKTAILPTVQTIFRSTEFWDSRGAKVRRPAENLIATIRILNLTATDLDGAVTEMGWWSQQAGNRPLCWVPPNGYPDVASAWRSSGALLALWEQQFALASGYAGPAFSTVSASQYYGGTSPTTVSDAIDALSLTLLGTALSANDKASILNYLGEYPTLTLTRSRLSYELNNVASLLLHSAHHALR